MSDTLSSKADLEGNVADAKVTRISDEGGNVYLGTQLAVRRGKAVLTVQDVEKEDGIDDTVWTPINITADAAWNAIKD